MNFHPERTPARSRAPIAAGRGVATQDVDCGYLHGPAGPGCPYCMTAMGSAVAQAAAVRAELIAAGKTAAERSMILLAWDRPAAGGAS